MTASIPILKTKHWFEDFFGTGPWQAPLAPAEFPYLSPATRLNWQWCIVSWLRPFSIGHICFHPLLCFLIPKVHKQRFRTDVIKETIHKRFWQKAGLILINLSSGRCMLILFVLFKLILGSLLQWAGDGLHSGLSLPALFDAEQCPVDAARRQCPPTMGSFAEYPPN